jgi:hypothetical protein
MAMILTMGILQGLSDKNVIPHPERTGDALLALYNFCEPGGPIIRDQSGLKPPMNLRVQSMQGVIRQGGALRMVGDTRVVSQTTPKRLVNAIKAAQSFSIEAWVTPANTTQKGPARIVSLSRNGSERNFTLGQDEDQYDVRCRTTKTGQNGTPSFPSGKQTLTAAQTHVTFTLTKDGKRRIYLNGSLLKEDLLEGSLENWKENVSLTLGNEVSGQRLWKGTFHMVALYGRALDPMEVKRHFKAGPKASDTQNHVSTGPAPADRFFRQHIAPMLSKHCLECHDTHTSKGGLDLSQRDAALEGGKHGKVIVPGDALASELWLSVHAGDMPDDRPPLTEKEREQLEQWINQGAAWPMETIDPFLYRHRQEDAGNMVRRLTVGEYVETVKDVLNVDIQEEAGKLMPRDLRADGFSNTAYNLNVDLGHVNAYATLAAIVVERMDVKAFMQRFEQPVKFTDNAMGAFLEAMGKWILRGPINTTELFAYRGITTHVAAAGGSYEEAVSLVVEAMLQSPRFLYRIETHMGDGTVWPLEDHQLASRISYIIWGSSPDPELMQAAEDGDLYNDATLNQQVQRMLDDPRAEHRSLEFARDWLHLDRLANMQPDPVRFPKWDPTLAKDMAQESLAFFRELIWQQKRPLHELFNARFTYVTPALARHYQLPEDVPLESGTGLRRVDLSPKSRRAGILTQGAVLTLGGDDASMVTRGLFVLHDVLRGVIKDPPPCVDTEPISTEAGLSQRGISTRRIENKMCGGCHEKFEPLAFGLETFDGLGSFRRKDAHGNQVREDGRIRVPGQPGVTTYTNTLELLDFLAHNPRVRETLTWKVCQFALGRPLGANDAAAVEKIHQEAHAGGGDWKSLISAIVRSSLVRNIKTETSNENP